ncbi:winged helix-turn-helix transcriptional regulator [Microbacterium lacticum]
MSRDPAVDAIQREGVFVDRDEWPAAGWCRMESALDVVGTRSAMLLIRELFYGGTRFDALARRTALSEAVVAGRLKQLHDAEIVERRPYQKAGQRTRDEYVLTPRGRALYPILVAFMAWGETLRDDHGSGVELVHQGCGAPLSVSVVCENGHDVPIEAAAVRIKDERGALKLKLAQQL